MHWKRKPRQAEVEPENGVGRTAAPALGQEAVAELAESIRSLWSGLLFFSMRYNIIRIYIHFIFKCCPTATIFSVTLNPYSTTFKV